jgi:molybdopterin converting factor subunit 1
MRVNVKLFAILRERAGTSELVIHLRPGATVADAAETLVEKFPDISPLLSRIVFAVNQTYSKRETPLSEGDELALIPPVSGGADDNAAAAVYTRDPAQPCHPERSEGSMSRKPLDF